MPSKEERKAAWERKKAKRRKDHNHGKNGWVAGNPRFNRAASSEDTEPKNVSMGKN